MICTLSATVCCFLMLIWLLNSEMFENWKFENFYPRAPTGVEILGFQVIGSQLSGVNEQ